MLAEDSARWREEINEYTREQVRIDRRIEHWVCEYWDDDGGQWRLLDADRDFLKAHSDIDVGYNLPSEYFEYAHTAWRRMRSDSTFNPDQYAEWPQDGRSHIRSQLLWDFYSLLNHDIAGMDKSDGSAADSTSPEQEDYSFVKEKSFDDLQESDLVELDSLATLLSGEFTIQDLVSFYHRHSGLRLTGVEADSFSFVTKAAGQ